MSRCTILKPNVSLAAKARRGPGLGIDEATAAAAVQVEVLRDDVAARVGVIVGQLEALRCREDARGEMRVLADELAGLCGPFGLLALGSTASGLCRLLDIVAAHTATEMAIAVHLDALQLLSRPDAAPEGEAAETLLGGLRKVLAAIQAGPDTA